MYWSQQLLVHCKHLIDNNKPHERTNSKGLKKKNKNKNNKKKPDGQTDLSANNREEKCDVTLPW